MSGKLSINLVPLECALTDKDWTMWFQSKLNCEVLEDSLAFEVRWAVAGDSIVIQLVAKLGKYRQSRWKSHDFDNERRDVWKVRKKPKENVYPGENFFRIFHIIF